MMKPTAILICTAALLLAACSTRSSEGIAVLDRSSPGQDRSGESLPRRGSGMLPFKHLMKGFKYRGQLDEAVLSIPPAADPPEHVFEGRLELLGEDASLPAFDFEFVQEGGYLVPVQRGLIIVDNPTWNYILEPGRAWQEPGDEGYTRASFPFALVPKGDNAVFNGTMSFLFDETQVSKVWYQVTQETTAGGQVALWGLLDAAYHPGTVDNAGQNRADFRAEMASRLPVKPIQSLADDYPGVDIAAFGSGVTPEHMTWYGVVVAGTNYLGGCQTRFGAYPYCEWMRSASYSTSKSAFTSLALMRLAQVYGPQVADLLVQDYLPETAASPGNWERVTFNHMIDMAGGNYLSNGVTVDDSSQQMSQYFRTQPYERRIAAALDVAQAAEPGTSWVYRTSDIFILTRALQNYLVSQRNPQADIFQFVVDEIYSPLGLGPGAYTSLRTADDNWRGQPEGGFGLYWIPNDIARLAVFLNNEGGQIDGEQVLHPALLSAAMQRDPGDRGMEVDARRRYNNAFWATRYTPADGFKCEFWVVLMQGLSGNVVAMMPNGVSYYYFSDNQEFTWEAALREADKISPLCP